MDKIHSDQNLGLLSGKNGAERLGNDGLGESVYVSSKHRAGYAYRTPGKLHNILQQFLHVALIPEQGNLTLMSLRPYSKKGENGS